jgi:tetratricopeptide (TPR) repeat protein
MQERHAQAALDAARPAIARLDRSRNSEELAADLIEAWSAVETALRSLLGGTPLAGQALIREARQRQMITFDQANALAEFHAARERSQDTSYHPTDNDINAAREGFLKLEASLMSPPTSDRHQTPPPGEAMSTRGLRMSPLGTPEAVPPPRSRPWWFPVLVIGGIVAVGAGVWLLVARGAFGGDDSIDRGVEYWQRGQRELAVGEFSRAARDDPKSAIPHVFLSRMAREVNNLTLAGQEATLAVQAEPTNPIALREMGSYLLAAGNYELSRRFYVRALQQSPDDRMAQGFLGCALIKLGRFDEGMRWMQRAGQGAWSRCAPTQPGMQPGMMPPPTGAPPTVPP